MEVEQSFGTRDVPEANTLLGKEMMPSTRPLKGHGDGNFFFFLISMLLHSLAII